MKPFVLRSQLTLLAILLTQSVSLALPPIKLRLREHYESHNIHYESLGVDSATYSGFSNTANLWFESPFIEAYGLSVSPVLGSSTLSSTSIQAPGTDRKVKVWRIGLEYKRFFAPSDPGLGIFGRVGLGLGILETRGTAGSYQGVSFYSGIGWEFLVWKIGISPEVGISPQFLSGGNSVMTSMFALGFHFYIMDEAVPGRAESDASTTP